MTVEDAARAWIGRTIEREDVVTARLVSEFEAALQPHLAKCEGVPLGLHWCLCPDILTSAQLGKDGHPILGIFLPETGLPRRMWAGGEINYLGVISLGDVVQRVSTIEDVVFKEGRNGKLCFVTVRHRYSVSGHLAVDDRQDIVYRAESALASSATPAKRTEIDMSAIRVVATPTLLFRYSALTFNGHRIHYDEPYACSVEGYAGLVVHGPLQATLMLNLAAKRLGGRAKRFSYRGVSPLICGQTFSVEAHVENGEATTRVVDAYEVVTMTGSAS